MTNISLNPLYSKRHHTQHNPLNRYFAGTEKNAWVHLRSSFTNKVEKSTYKLYSVGGT